MQDTTKATDKKNKIEPTKQKKLEGLGGWLILVTVGLLLTPIIWGVDFFVFLFLAINSAEPSVMSDIAILSFSLIFVVLSFNGLRLEFKKSRRFPKFATYFLWISVLIVLLLDILFNYSYANLVGSVISALIWTQYFKVSIRVKNTFVNP